jgi:hypothetical protein
MRLVRYVGPAHVRVMERKDFADNGVDQTAVTWNAGNDHTAEVSPEAADWLLNGCAERHEFRDVTPEKKPAADKAEKA